MTSHSIEQAVNVAVTDESIYHACAKLARHKIGSIANLQVRPQHFGLRDCSSHGMENTVTYVLFYESKDCVVLPLPTSTRSTQTFFDELCTQNYPMHMHFESPNFDGMRSAHDRESLSQTGDKSEECGPPKTCVNSAAWQTDDGRK